MRAQATSGPRVLSRRSAKRPMKGPAAARIMRVSPSISPISVTERPRACRKSGQNGSATPATRKYAA